MANPDPRCLPLIEIELDQIQALISPALKGSAIAGVERVEGGLVNTLYRVMTADGGASLCLRIFAAGEFACCPLSSRNAVNCLKPWSRKAYERRAERFSQSDRSAFAGQERLSEPLAAISFLLKRSPTCGSKCGLRISVGADLRVCPGGYLYTRSGADTQVCPYCTRNCEQF